MTREERNTKLKHLITCLKCEESGKECDANCSVQYEAGNMGEIIENLEAISKALEQELKWIPMAKRPMTEEEIEHYFEYTDMRIDDAYTILDCPLPEDGQEVLISSGGYVCVDTFCIDNGCYFEGVDIDDVDAWMPLPEPYNAESEEV